MASLASSCRAAARLATHQLRVQQRAGFRTTAIVNAAQNFTMPALSPTMTEGNIASWKVKEGDSFVAGDVLLEVETDKAQMDVEAQDDGVMAKIMTSDGSKGVKVGTRIAVIAEPGDDVSSLEIPPEESSPSPEPEKSSKPPSEQSTQPAPSESQPQEKKAAKPKGAGQKQTYPLYPSVQVLLHTHHLSAEDIPATGPNGRLLKGDVLAHLEQISPSYPKELASRFKTLSHLDLSNIKPAAPKEKPAVKQETPKEVVEDLPIQLAVPVRLSAVLEVQKRMQDSLGISLPLSTFLARAVALANEDLPTLRTTPTADELFDAVLGLDTIHHAQRTKDGTFEPEIVALPDPSIRMAALVRARKPDLFDELVGAAPKKNARTVPAAAGVLGEENVFSLLVEKKEEKRAKVFLERVKSVLEVEPGRLVL